MKQPENQWLVRLEHGKILGPYSTSKILQLISQGTFTGDEAISLYPDGEWQSISKQDQFYDQLLEALSDISGDVTPANIADTEEETVITQVGPREDFPNNLNEKVHKVIADYENRKKPLEQLGESPFRSNPQGAGGGGNGKVQPFVKGEGESNGIIDLEDLAAVKEIAKKKIMKAPVLVVVAVALVLGAIYLVLPGPSAGDKIHLIGPRKGELALNQGARAMDEATVKENLRRAFLNYQSDDFNSYLEAQNILVKTVEGSGQNTDVRGLLCLVYKELWPYTYQNSQDIKVLNFVSQSTKALDPVGLNGITCDTVRLILTGRYKEARGILEAALSNYPTAPVLYQLKGEIIAGDRDYQTAVAYMEKATELWPTWAHSYVEQSLMQKAIGESQKARDLLKRVLVQNSKHKRALVYLGLLEHEKFRKSTDALEYFSKARSLREPLPKLLEARMYLSLAQIYESRDSKSKALEYAKKSYALNSSNNESKQLIIKIGGMEQLKNTKVEDAELVYLGDQYRRSGDCFAAQAEYKAAFESDPTNAIAAMKAGQCLWELNQVQEAITYLQKATKADPQLMEAYVTEADYYSQRYNFISASKVLNRARNVAPNSHELWRGYALIELRRNNASGAIAYAKRALQIYDTDIKTQIILAEAHMAANEYKEAFRYAAKSIELDPTNVEAQAVYARGLVYLQGVESAIYYLQEMISKYPYVVDYRLALADVLRTDERFKEALDVYQRVVDIYPNNKAAFIGLGKMQQATGYMEEALQSFLNAAALDPSDAEALFNAGLLYLETQRYTIAIQQFERVLQINSLYPRVHYYIGRSALMMGDQGRALTEAENEKKVNPNLADAYLLAAEAYAQAKSYALCAGEYQRALRLRSQGAEIYVKVARCYRKSGSLDVAGAMLGLAKDKESGYAEIYKEQGALYEMQGEYASAKEAYDLYLELSPNASDRVEIERKIASLN